MGVGIFAMEGITLCWLLRSNCSSHNLTNSSEEGLTTMVEKDER